MGVESVDPSLCGLWDLHDRVGDDIDAGSCGSLIRSFQQNGQKHAVLGRAIAVDCGFRYELIYGARRLFAARHLGMDLLVDVRELDDRTALIEMDIENRVRKDISAYERGLSYKRWLRAGHFESQAALARCLGISEAQISRLLRYADLPCAVVAVFRSPRDIREEWAGVLAKHCADPELRQKVIRRARSYAASQHKYPPQAIYDLLAQGGQGKSQHRPRSEVVKTSEGSPFMRLSYRTKTIHLILPRNTVTSSLLSEITNRVRELVEREGQRGIAQVNLASVSAARVELTHPSCHGAPRARRSMGA